MLIPILQDVCFRSWVFLPSPPAKCGKRLSIQLICRDHEHAVTLRIWHIDDAEVPSGIRLAQGNSGAFAAISIFDWPLKDFDDLVLFDVVTINVRQSRRRINIEPRSQFFSLAILPRSNCSGGSSTWDSFFCDLAAKQKCFRQWTAPANLERSKILVPVRKSPKMTGTKTSDRSRFADEALWRKHFCFTAKRQKGRNSSPTMFPV